jgi:transposase
VLKRELIERSLQPGASVSGIALDSGINANLLFKWRREHLRADARARISTVAAAAPVLLPVKIESPMPQVVAAPAAPPPAPTSRGKVGSIEIDIGGARVTLRGAVDPSSVRAVLQALRGLE